MIYKPLFFQPLLLIDRALHCNKTTLWYQVMFALQTDRCVICLLNLFNSGTHTESGVGCELYQTLYLSLLTWDSVLWFQIASSRFPQYGTDLSVGFPLKIEEVFVLKIPFTPISTPTEHLSITHVFALHARVIIHPKSQQLHSLLPRQHITSVKLHDHVIINKTFFQCY